MAPDAPTPELMPTQAPRAPPTAPLPYTETRAPRGAPVEPVRSTEGERRSEQRSRQPRHPSIEQLRETATRSRPTPARPSSRDEEIEDLRAVVDGLRRDKLSLQHDVDRVRLERNQLRERLELAEEQLNPRRSHRREEPRTGYHPYPRPPTRSPQDPSPSGSTARLHPRPSPSTRMSEFNPDYPNSIPIPSSSMPEMGSGSSKGKGKAVEEPEKWDMAKGYEELEDDPSEDEETQARKEKLRQVKVAGRTACKGAIDPPSLGYEPCAELHGSWAGFTVNTIGDWTRLYNAAMKGDGFALGYIAYLNSLYQRPSLPRSQGIQRLMSGFSALARFQQPGLRDYKANVKAYKDRHGTRTDAPGPSVPGPSAILPPSAPISNNAGDDAAAAPPPEELQEDISNDLGYYRSDSPGYEAHIPPPFARLPNANPPHGDRDGTNPHDPPQSVGNDWATTPIGSWPIGMRIDVPGSVPRNPTSEERASSFLARPHLPDVEAVRWRVELSPFRRHHQTSTRAARRTWNDMFVLLFSIPGLYSAIIKRTGFPLGNRTREHFPFDTRNMDIVHVAVWIHDHGLDVCDPQVEDIERWAQYVRTDGGDSRNSDGHWLVGPHDVHAVLATHEGILRDVATSFRYPPRVPSAFARSWASAAERAVDRARRQLGLVRVWDDLVSTDEDAEMMDVAPRDPTNPGGST